jgi:cytochrome b561
MPRWQRRAARASHGALYGLMLLLPLSGWVQAAAAPEQDILGIENRVFGGLALPDPWQPGVASVAEAAGALHAACAWTLAALLLVHAGAALLHHFRARDGVLLRMTFGA